MLQSSDASAIPKILMKDTRRSVRPRHQVAKLGRGGAGNGKARVAAAAAVVACLAANAPAGTFERWIGGEAGSVSNDAETATLSKHVGRFRMKLAGMGRPIATGEPEFGIWIKIGCRTRNPAKPPSVWISLPGHPDQESAPHWLTDPIGFWWTLARHGEFERTRLTMEAGGRLASATLARRRVVAWTEDGYPWMSIEFEDPEGTGGALLEDIGNGMGPEKLTLVGDGTRIEMTPEWNDEDRAMAADMVRHCP